MAERLRLGVLATHPIQYHAPLFRELAADPAIDLTVYFAHKPTPADQGAGFGVPFEWDVDLTGGYRHEWLENIARHPDVSNVDGCDTPAIGSIIERSRFHVFLVMGWHSRTYRQAIRGCWHSRTPVMVRGDSQLLDDPAVKRVAKRAVYPLFMRRFSACLSVGIRSDEYFRYYGARRVVRAPHYVDNDFFATTAAAGAAERARLRQEWGIPNDALVCLFAGKFVAKKQPMDLVRALAAVTERHLFGIFAGDGDLRAACEAESLRLGARARFIGFRNQQAIRGVYAASDMLVLPSGYRETWGLVVNEAMASGRAAIVSDAVGCAPDLIVEGETGSVYRSGDVGALTECLRAAAADPARVAAMGVRAKQHIAGFSVQAARAGVVAAAHMSARRSA